MSNIVVKKMNESSHRSSCYFIEEKTLQQNICEKESNIEKQEKEQKNQVIIIL